jgi:hypothetical protein
MRNLAYYITRKAELKKKAPITEINNNVLEQITQLRA